MQQCVPQASGSGLTELQMEEELELASHAKLECNFLGLLPSFLSKKNKNKVSELPKCPDCSSFIAFYLHGNYEPTAISPLFFQRMALLQVLDLSRTSIKSLPKSLPKLVALKKLLLQGCDLFMELSPQVGELKNLEELDLDETEIMDLPRETGKLLKLRKLKVSFYHLCGKKKLKSNILIHPETISNFSQLTELGIDVNPADKRWDDSVEAVLKEVCNSKTLRTLSLYLPEFQLLDDTSSIYTSLSCFRFTVGRDKRRIISRVTHGVEAKLRNWDKCLKFVNGENIPVQIKGVLKYSTSFFLDRHATAVNLSEFGIENMKGLKFCLLAECNEMETLIDGDMHYERNEDDQSESPPDSVEHVLESLEYLSIYYMENLQSIWKGPNCFGCMSKLKFLALHTCPKLSKIFCLTLLENFVNLEEIIIEDCPNVRSLVSHTSVKPMMSDKIFLPRLKRLLLLYLPELVSISNGLLIAPKLEIIGCYNCPKLTSISKMELSSKTLKIIKGEYQWWDDMNWNETEWGNRTDYLMRIFSPIDNEKDVMTQLTEDRDLLEATIQNEGQEQECENQPDNLMRMFSPVDNEKDVTTQLTEDRGLLESSTENEDQQQEWDHQLDYLMHIVSPINNEKDMMTHLAEDNDLLETAIENEGQQPDDEKDEMTQMAEEKDLLETPIENEGRQQGNEKYVMTQLAEDRDLLEVTIESKGQQSESVNQPDYLMHVFSPINNGKEVMTQLVEDKDLPETTIDYEGQQPDNKNDVTIQFAEDIDRDILETMIEIEGQQPEDGELLEVQDHESRCSGYTEEGTTERNVVTMSTPSVTVFSPTSEPKTSKETSKELKIPKGLMNLFSLCWEPFRHEKGNNHETNGVLGGGKDGFWYQDIGKYGSKDFSMAMIQANQVLEDQFQIESFQYGTFVGIYDGHGGPETARYVCDHLFKHFRAITAKSQGVVTTETIRRAFHQTEEGFTTLVSESWTTQPRIATVGTSCLVGVILRRTLFIANLGESRVVLGKKVGNTRGIVAMQLSIEHTADREAIREELRELHPHDSQIVVLKHGVWRIKGIIRVSRSIGDVYMKHECFNREPISHKFRLREPMNKPILSADPTIISHELQPNDSFLIFASDGLWEHLSNEEAVDIVHSHPRAGSAKRLVEAALQEAAKKREMKYSHLRKVDKGVRRHFHDDITVIVLFFNHDLISKGGVQYHQVSIRSALDHT